MSLKEEEEQGVSALSLELNKSSRPAAYSGYGWARRVLHDSVTRTTLINLSLILTWYTLSTALSLYNKKLVGREHGFGEKGAFPAPLLLTSIQFLLQCFLAKFTLLTGVVTRTQDKPKAWAEWCRTVLPNGVTTGLDIGLSNMSMAYIALSFYTMCKSTTPIFLLGFAFAWGLERPSWNLAAVVGMMVSGLILLVMGEMSNQKFHAVGFGLVMSASCLSGLRFTLTQVLLQGSGDHSHGKVGGPVELLEALTPLMGATVALASLASEQPWLLAASPYFASLSSSLVTMGIIGVGAVLAFLMVWTEFAVIQQTSALTFMVAGCMKEVVTVMAAIIVMHERFTLVNAIGLLVVMSSVLLFNLLKLRGIKKGEAKAVQVVQPQHREPEEQEEQEGLLARAAGGAAGGLGAAYEQDGEHGRGGGHKGGGSFKAAAAQPKGSVVEVTIGLSEPSVR